MSALHLNGQDNTYCLSAFECETAKQNDLKLIKFTKRQLSCALYLLQGLKYKEIAHELSLSVRTVESYIEQLREKLKCRNKAELVIKLMCTIERIKPPL